MGRFAHAFFLLLVLSANALQAAELSAADLDRRRKALRDLLDEQWDYTMRTSPELASTLGDRRYNDQVSDVSEAGVRAALAQTRRFLKRFESIDTAGFSEQERLSRELMVRGLRENIEWAGFNWWQMPVSPVEGIHLAAAELPPSLPFRSVKDYDDYIARLGKLPKVLDDTIANMRKGMAAKLMPPGFLLEKVAGQASAIASTPADQSPFAEPLNRFPDGFSESEKERIRGAVLTAIERSMVPAYRRFAAFVKDEYAPSGQTSFGMWALPDGKARYAFRVRQQTTTMFRRNGGYTAFIEGWGLYAERLAKEAGAYDDPYSDYGRLNNEILRAIRLVADTGFHHKRWTREQVVQFFHDHSAIDEVRVQSETDRYLANPGQALAYKIGELKIRELRDQAQKELGAGFDLRRFHDEILGAGAIPLDTLDERIAKWIRSGSN